MGTTEEITDPAKETGNDGKTGNPGDGGLTVEQLQAELTKVRAEAAGYRVKLREAEGRKPANTQPEKVADGASEQVSKLQATVDRLSRRLLVADLAGSLPAELRDMITGSSEEEIKAQVETLRRHLKPQATPLPAKGLTGGLDPSGNGDSLTGLTPEELVKKFRPRRI